jgi:hypothetical protein
MVEVPPMGADDLSVEALGTLTFVPWRHDSIDRLRQPAGLF